jgi:lysophospholipase L1-like esterase
LSTADRKTYLSDIIAMLQAQWPENRRINVVCHGHSVPAGYFATPRVDTFSAYPHLLHRGLKDRFPFAVINVIVTAIGGENSLAGAGRFEEEVLCHRPDLITIDYGLNDRGIGLGKAERSWREMIEKALEREIKLILLTPTADVTQGHDYGGDDAGELGVHAAQIRSLADEYGVGLADSLAAFERYQSRGDLSDLLSWANHPNRRGHEIVARNLMRWFPAG